MVDAEILRDGLLLRQVSLRANDVVDKQTGHLTLEGTAEGERVTFRVGRLPALIFEDTFPYVGGNNQKFGVFWPREAGLVSLAAMQQPLPVQPSPLEEGDELFVGEQWAAALSLYRQQAGVAADDRPRDQARFKEALCLVKLDENDEAQQIFESLANSSDERLHLLAGCQLWLLHLQHGRYSEAEFVFESLQSQYDVHRLTMLVPEAQRRDILAKTFAATTGLNLYRFSPDDLRFLEQAHRVGRLLNPHQTSHERGMYMWQFVRGCHIAGEIDKGINNARGHLNAGAGLDANMTISILSECSWMLQQRGQFQQAKELVNKRLGDREQANSWQLQLLVERARIAVTEEQWDAAADDLDFFLASPACGLDYREFSAACLMRGLLHQRDGEAERAAELWHRGLFENWLAETGQNRHAAPSLTGMEAAHVLLLGALCGDQTEKQIVKLLTQSTPTFSSGLMAQFVKQYSHVLAPAIGNMAHSERGQRVIWEVAFHKVSLKELIHHPLNLIFLEASRLGAAPGDWTPEEEQIMWDLMDRVFDLYAVDEIGMPQAVQLMLTWKGANNIFGWKGVAPSLQADVRGPAAYLFGCRYLKLGKPDDAREFFLAAIENAADSSALKKLAEAKIAEISNGSVQ